MDDDNLTPRSERSFNKAADQFKGEPFASQVAKKGVCR